MVGRFTRPVCLGPRTVCHCSAPSPWSSSHCPLTLLRERSSRLGSPWPEVSQGHCILSDLLTERAGDCACESLALSARGEIHELCVSPLLPAAKITDAPNARNANGVFRKTVMLRPLDDLSRVGGWENWATTDYAATRTFGVGILNARFLIPKLNSCDGSVIFDRLNISRYFRGAGGRSSNGRRPCARRTATCPTIIRCRRAWILGNVFAWTARSCSRHRAHSHSPSWRTRTLRVRIGRFGLRFTSVEG